MLPVRHSVTFFCSLIGVGGPGSDGADGGGGAALSEASCSHGGADCSKLKPSKKTGSLPACVDHYDIEFDGKRSRVALAPAGRHSIGQARMNHG